MAHLERTRGNAPAHPDGPAAHREALAGEGLREESTFAGARAGEHGGAYFVQQGGRRRQFERHLKGGNARGAQCRTPPRIGARIRTGGRTMG